MSEDGIFIDRDPELFEHVLKFLRSDRTYLPRDVSQDVKNLIETELRYWKLDKGLIKMYNYATESAQILNNILEAVPEIDSSKNQKSLEKWKSLEPISIEDIHRDSDFKVFIDDEEQEVKKMVFKNYVAIGQFRRNTNKIDGIARRIFDSTLIQEGQFKNGDLHGYCRIIYQNGAYYEGMFSNFMRNGLGTSVSATGTVQKGIWKDNDYVGPIWKLNLLENIICLLFGLIKKNTELFTNQCTFA